MQKINLNYPRVEKVIVSRETRGTGTDIDPMRPVVSVFTLNGELIAENDPCRK